MKIGKTLYVWRREDLRKWLAKNHSKEKEIWLIFYKKASGKPRISYDDAVEEALCFGWIDSIVKSVDSESFAQRLTPRRPRSNLSQLNIERIRKLIATKQMTDAGLTALQGIYDHASYNFEIPKDILRALMKDEQIFSNFQKFPKSYQRIRIGFIEGARDRPDEFKKRLNYFLKMTSQNKRFGTEV